MTVRFAILNGDTVVCVLRIRCIAAAGNRHVFDRHAVGRRINKHIEANRLGLSRGDCVQRNGQDVASVVILINCRIAVHRDVTVECQTAWDCIGQLYVADVDFCARSVGYLHRVGQHIAYLGAGFVHGFHNRQIGVAVRNDNAVVLILYRFGVVRGQGGKVLNSGIIGIFVDGRHKGSRAAGIRRNDADIYCEQTACFIIGIIRRIHTVQHDRPVLENQASRDDIGNDRIFYGYSCGLAVGERQRIGDLIANLGRGLVRTLFDIRTRLAVTDGNTIVRTLSVRDVVAAHNRCVVNRLTVSGIIDCHRKRDRLFRCWRNAAQRHGQGAGLIIERIISRHAIHLYAAVYKVKLNRDSVSHGSVFDLVNGTLCVAERDCVSQLIPDLSSRLVQTFFHIGRGVAFVDINAVIRVLVLASLIAVLVLDDTVCTLGDSGIVNRLVVHIAVHGCLESHCHRLACGNVAQRNSKQTVFKRVLRCFVIDIYAAVHEGQAVRQIIGEYNFLPRGRRCFIIRQLDRVS